MARMNKKRRAEQLVEQMQAGNYNPLEELIKLAKHSRIDPKTKIRIATELMQYMYPKQKAIELDQNQGQPVTFNFDLGGQKVTTAPDQETD